MPNSLIVIDGTPLTFASLARIGASGAKIGIDAVALGRATASWKMLLEAIMVVGPIYGVSTGVGAQKSLYVTNHQLGRFHAGLVRAHHFGVGAPLPEPVVRTAMAIRANTALGGHTGCSAALIQRLVAMLNADAIPIVRREGSLGCADIGLMGQIASAMTGAGEISLAGARMPAGDALARAGLAPFDMAHKDALASVSSNAAGYASAFHVIRRSAGVLRALLASGIAASAAMGASTAPWRSAVAMGTGPQATIGRWLTRASETSGIATSKALQDPLSVRMMPQVFAAVFDAAMRAGAAVVAETARSDDNPVVVGDGLMTSGGSLPLDVALALQGLALALAHSARNTMNRCILIANGHMRDLPINLVPPSGDVTGFGPALKLAGELFARAHALSLPISAQALVVADALEDEATLLPLIVERIDAQATALVRLAALEAMMAAQAMDLVREKPEGIVGAVHAFVRESCAYYDVDRPISADLESLAESFELPKTLAHLAAMAPLIEIDRFFALPHHL